MIRAMNTLKYFKKNIQFNRIYFYILSVAIVLSILSGGFIAYSNTKTNLLAEEAKVQDWQKKIDLLKQNIDLNKQIEEAKALYPQINLDEELKQQNDLTKSISLETYDTVKKVYDELLDRVNKKIASEQTKGILSGKTTYGSTSLATVIKIMQNEVQIAEIKTGDDGVFSYWLPSGQYKLTTAVSGYQDHTQDFEIKTGETTDLQISLQKIPVPTIAPKPKSAVTAAPTNDGIYSKETIATDRGSFVVHLLRIDLSQYEMRLDTAADGDCITNCPVKNLSGYISQNGGFAGIHGTYFCPTSYPDCAAQTNSFYYKMFNTRLNKKINWTNGLGDYLPFLSIDRSGKASYSSSWSSVKDSDMQTGISCRPHLVENSQIVLRDSDMDSDKERYSKISHGFIGLKGQTIYAGIVLSANLPDSAAVAKALGIENAFNIDGGGTSAMYYNSSYKVGPGRDMPNAIVFVKK